MSDWNAQEWDRCCTRCHTLLDWQGDLPEVEEDAICHDCAWTELEALRKIGRTIYENMKGTCDYGEPPCQKPSFAGFMHGMCNDHAEELDAPVGALKDQTMLEALGKALRFL